MARIHVEGVHKTYPNGHVAARGIELEIKDGEFVVLVGASGCGKSTTLRMIAGLETPTAGKIWIGDRDVTRVRVQDRDLAMVFQSYALYPHKTVRKNLTFALELRGMGQAEIDKRIVEVSRALSLDELLDRKPGQLSGGQRQRVALGRAIVREPKAFLFDEPLSNLDAKLRVQTRAELARLHRRLGATMVYVTHDQEEAMTLGDRIAVLDGGKLQQCAPPREVYLKPGNQFVAGFVGNPSMNFVAAELVKEGGGLRVKGPGVALDVDATGTLANGGANTRDVQLGIRPQDVEVVDAAAGDIKAKVDVIELLGAEVLAHLEADAIGLRIVAPADRGLKEGETIGLKVRKDRLHLFAKDGGARLN